MKKNKPKKYTLRNLNLWILFSIAWIAPQAFTEYLTEFWANRFIIITLVFFGFIICFTNALDKVLIEEII